MNKYFHTWFYVVWNYSYMTKVEWWVLASEVVSVGAIFPVFISGAGDKELK